MSAAGFVLGTALLGGVIWALVDDSEPRKPGSPNDFLGTSFGSLSCGDALANLPPPFANEVTRAIAIGNNVQALDALALTLESNAGAPSMPEPQRAAILKAAACIRDRAAILRAAGAT